MLTRTCTKCGLTKPENFFSRSRKLISPSNPEGISNTCKAGLCGPRASASDLGTTHVPGTNNEYSIDDSGRVYNHLRGRWVNQILAAGYYKVSLGKYGCRAVHHLVLETFVGPRPPGLLGLHADDNPSHNFLSNLEWGTSRTNAIQSVCNTDRYKLTPTLVRKARMRYSHGVKAISLAREYHVSYLTMLNALNRMTWKWVD